MTKIKAKIESKSKSGTQQGKPVVVIGDGWSALATVGTLVCSESCPEVRWIAGSISRLLAPLPSFETAFGNSGMDGWRQLAQNLGVDLGEEHTGTFTREFKNKAFREPTWTKSPEVEARAQERVETLWGPEINIAQLMEARFDLTAAEIETAVREKLVNTEFESLRRIEGNPVTGFRIEGSKVAAVVLSSGEEVECESVIYADRWGCLPKIQGLPKGLSFTRGHEAHGMLQATFTHAAPVGVDVREGFFAPMNREAGEEFERRLWGYFSSDGMKSYWSICLTADEAEDNHEIAKKLRRMKTTLDKMFTGSCWLPNPEQGFMANIRDEQVRFDEAIIFEDTEVPTEPIRIEGMENLSFITDGYGPSRAFEQVERTLGPISVREVISGDFDSETNSENSSENVSDEIAAPVLN